MKTRRKFDREFKLKVVELSYERENIKELAHEMELRLEFLVISLYGLLRKFIA